jgi:hypothetical protein
MGDNIKLTKYIEFLKYFQYYFFRISYLEFHTESI